MKTIGIIGGLGPESTVDYYKRMIATVQAYYPERAYPEIIVFSANLTKLLELVNKKDWEMLTTWLVEKIEAVSRAGAEFAAIASNTPHIVFDAVQSRSPIPLISIVEETCKQAESLGLKRLGLMGTKFTMEADFYQKSFAAKGMSVAVPDETAQQCIQEKLFSEIELGIIKESTRQDLLGIVRQMIAKEAIEALILGCTELPLILTKDEFGIPFLNTTAIQVASIMNYCMTE